jgi:outer membrane lipoprotein-sorting protein
MLSTRWAPPLAAALLLAALALPARADEKADALLKQARDAMSRLQTLQADLEVSITGSNAAKGTLVLKRPNLARIELKAPLEMLIASDGKDLYLYQASQDQYQKTAVDARGANIAFPYAMELIQGFFVPQALGKAPTGATVTHAGKETVAGDEYEVVEVAVTQPVPTTVRYFISPKDHLLNRVSRRLKAEDREVELVATLKNVRAGGPVAATAFKWRPPATAKAYQQPSLADFEKKLVPVGKAAPDFNLPTPQGGRLSLGDALKGKKALLLNFWFYD